MDDSKIDPIIFPQFSKNINKKLGRVPAATQLSTGVFNQTEKVYEKHYSSQPCVTTTEDSNMLNQSGNIAKSGKGLLKKSLKTMIISAFLGLNSRKFYLFKILFHINEKFQTKGFILPMFQVRHQFMKISICHLRKNLKCVSL